MDVGASLLSPSHLARLGASRFRALQLAETTSTNTVLMGLARAGEPEGLVVVADHQSAGRGRLDRSWASPPGASVLMSVLLRPAPETLPRERHYLLLAALGLAVIDAAGAAGAPALRLKWPNDVIAVRPGHPDAKVAGLLAEAAPAAPEARPARPVVPPPAGVGLPPPVVLGAGVNVSWAPAGLPAASLQELAGRPVSRADVLVEMLLALDRLYGDWAQVGRRYRSSCATLGRAVTVHWSDGSPPLEGRADGLDGAGRLVVRDRDGKLHTVAAADVVHATGVSG